MVEQAGEVLGYATPEGRRPEQSRWGVLSVRCAGISLAGLFVAGAGLVGLWPHLMVDDPGWLWVTVFLGGMAVLAGAVLTGTVAGIVGVMQKRARRGMAVVGLIVNLAFLMLLALAALTVVT